MSDTVKICGVDYPVLHRLAPNESDGAARCVVQTLGGACTVVERRSGWFIVGDEKLSQETKPQPKRAKR